MNSGRLIRRLPVLVLVLLVGVAVATFFLARRAIDDQERRILDERTGEVALILESTLGQVPSSVRPLGVAARLGDPPEAAFLAEARSAGLPGPGQTLALVRREGDRLIVAAAAGAALDEGEVLAGARAAVVERALAQPAMAITEVFGEHQLGFALGPPVTAHESVVYLEAVLAPRSTPVTYTEPFDDLDVVVYATSRADPAQVIATTAGEIPLSGGEIATRQIPILGATWLLTTSATQPMVGPFANAVPWVLLVVGLMAALVATAVVVVLMRRRDYAIALANKRTAELARSQERLVLQERLAAIGEVAAAVGHELRNPLGVLTNALYLIRISPPDATARHIETAEREVAAAAAIVDSLLDFAREHEPVTGPVDLADLVAESLSVAPAPDGVEVVRKGLDAAVLADRRQLRQVLLNLLTNAYEAIDGEGVVTIEAARRGAELEIRVTDTGPGIDEETASRIFEPFFTRKAKGIGLGLPVSQRIVEKHGGTIAAENAAGRGTTFVLTLPAAAVAGSVA